MILSHGNSPKRKQKIKNKNKAIGQMFLNTDKVKVVQANKDNIVYYNNYYDSFKTEKARAAAE